MIRESTPYTANQVAAMDRYSIEEVGIDLTQLMEVAGLRTAELAIELMGEEQVAVLVGPGGNGGDALVAAKWLHLWEYDAVVTLSRPEEECSEIVRHQLAVWRNLDGKVTDMPPKKCDGVIDGLIGYSLKGDPSGKSAELIEWANAQSVPTLALDVPSGLDATSGEPANPCIQAEATVVYGVWKQGLFAEGASTYTGDLHLVDIGFPREFPEEVLTE